MTRRTVFTGHIAGLGSTSGVRMVVGSWLTSPFGQFADVMVETADGERILLAPNDAVAEFVSSTYSFDAVDVGPAVRIRIRRHRARPRDHLSHRWSRRVRLAAAPGPGADRDGTGVAARDQSRCRPSDAGRPHRGHGGQRSPRILRGAPVVPRCRPAWPVPWHGPRRPGRAAATGPVRVLLRASGSRAGVGDDDDRPACGHRMTR